MNIYLLQFSPVWEDKENNFEQVKKWIEPNKPSSNSLLILPETFATGFSLSLDKTLAGEPHQTEFFLKNLSLEFGTWVMGGMITPALDSSTKGKNSVVVYSPDGTKKGSYEKIHLFNPSGEEKVHLPGNQVEVFEINGLKICPLICYDLRFPEVFREGTKNGAEVFVVHACWPNKRMNHWRILLQARAIENQAYVIGINRTGEEPETQYEGGSMVVDPQGNIVLELGNKSIGQEVVLKKKLIDEWRASFPALPNRSRSV